MPDEAPRKIEIEKLDKAMAAGGQGAGELTWRAPDTAPFELTGFPWHARDRVYRRLPVKPAHPIREPVDNLAWCTAGGQIRFASDSPRVSVRVQLRAPAGMVHMPATGQCGFDLYVGPPEAVWYGNTTKYPIREDRYEIELFKHADRAMRAFTLYFPLYQGVQSVELGLEPGARLEAPPARAREGRVVVYGTSITQGGCASRPGMCYTNILSRALNLDFVNLGFSGNGKGEPELARLILEIEKPILYILDYEANTDLDGLKATLDPFIRILRETRPALPILALSRIPFAADRIHADRAQARIERRDFISATVARLKREGDANLHFLDGGELLAVGGYEGTVDGVHPTDLGFWSMAQALEPVVRKLAR
ncbi:MAG: SGNH/GDSL hydrolase family protein [Planctomycetota bacterium]|nr:SGNH/GDSL hydrolase family protein [Planctomycetota bacterium]